MYCSIPMSCGHVYTTQIYGSKESQLVRIRSLQKFGLCPECYATKKRAEEKKQGLLLNVDYGDTYDLSNVIDDSTGHVLFTLWFSGDTFPCKDEIKALGYKWCDNMREESGQYDRRTKRWIKTITEEEYEDELDKISRLITPELKIDDSSMYDPKIDGYINRSRKKLIAELQKRNAQNDQ